MNVTRFSIRNSAWSLKGQFTPKRPHVIFRIFVKNKSRFFLDTGCSFPYNYNVNCSFQVLERRQQHHNQKSIYAYLHHFKALKSLEMRVSN